jgi:hypothetical protein
VSCVSIFLKDPVALVHCEPGVLDSKLRRFLLDSSLSSLINLEGLEWNDMPLGGVMSGWMWICIKHAIHIHPYSYSKDATQNKSLCDEMEEVQLLLTQHHPPEP